MTRFVIFFDLSATDLEPSTISRSFSWGVGGAEALNLTKTAADEYLHGFR